MPVFIFSACLDLERKPSLINRLINMSKEITLQKNRGVNLKTASTPAGSPASHSNYKINQSKSNKSRAAVLITSLYPLAVAASLIIMLMTAEDTPMPGIFLVMVTLPWSILLTWIQGALHLDSIPLTLNGLFLLAGGLVNSFVLYKLISFIAGRFSR